MNKTAIVVTVSLVVGAIMLMSSKKKSSSSQYEGYLLKGNPYQHKNDYVKNGKRYEIKGATAWEMAFAFVNHNPKFHIELPLEEIEKIPLGGYVSDTGELINY